MRDEATPRRRSRRRAIGDLMAYTALGGLVAGVIACMLRWEFITSGEFLPGFHPLVLALLTAVAGAAVGLAVAGSAAYPLYRTYGPDSNTGSLLAFTAGMLAVPVVALGVMLWVKLTNLGAG